MNAFRLACALAAFALVPSCATPLVQPATAWVRADRLTFDEVAPRFTAYVEADPSLSDPVRANLLGLIDDWRFRLETAEESLPAATPPALPELGGEE